MYLYILSLEGYVLLFQPSLENPTAVLWVIDVRNPSLITQRDVKPPREIQDQIVNVWFVIIYFSC